ncbi:MAG: elongation factor 1-alpha C-terminal domain-related protein, partial [Acidimicrobiales bacterium]
GGRSYAGMVSGGSLFPGEDVVVLPGGARSRVLSVATFDGELTEALPSISVTVTLEDDLDVSRGDLIAPVGSAPTPLGKLEATLCWFAERPLEEGQQVLVKHTTRVTPARVYEVRSRLDVGTLTLSPAQRLGDNEIGTVRLAVATPLVADEYRFNRVTGSFVVIDHASNAILAAGMVGSPLLATEVEAVAVVDAVVDARRWTRRWKPRLERGWMPGLERAP